MSTPQPNETDETTKASEEVSAAGEAHAELVTEPTDPAAPEETRSGSDEEAKPEGEPKPERPPPDYREVRIQTLERTLQEREATLHSYIRAHKKAEAEFEAYKQRLERDRERELVADKAKFVERLLDVEDNLERTLAAAKQVSGAESLATGIEMVHKQFIERMGELGLERVDPTGQPFDPTSMEALGMVPVDNPAKDNHVVLTMRTGYRIGDREIRPALVQVGRFMS